MLKEYSEIISRVKKYERNLSVIINDSKENILIVSSQTKKILFANSSACKYLGFKTNEIKGISLCDIFSKEYPSVDLNESNQEGSFSIELCRFITKPGYSFLAEKKSEIFKLNNENAHFISFQDISEISSTSVNKINIIKKYIPIYEAVNDINQKIGCVTHDMFLKNMTYSLSALLKVKWSMVCHIIEPSCKKAEVMMLWDQKNFQKDLVYSIKGTPCEFTYKSKEPYICDKNLIKRFPKDIMAREMGVDSYLGVPILSSERKVLGMLAIMNSKPIRGFEKMKAKIILKYMAIRCSQEIKNNQFNRKNERVKNIDKLFKVLPDQKDLSKREKEVVSHVINGLTDSNIAQRLSISIPTVKFHLKNIYRKLGINNRKGFLKICYID